MVFNSNHPKMHACVDSLYTIDGDTDKSKIMDIIRVMKGALSVSKSKTGEVIYRSNKNEVKYLDRKIVKFEKDIIRAKTNIECQKRDVLRKWSLVFGHQKTLCESIKSFDEMINNAVELQEIETSERSNQLEQSLNSHREEDPVSDNNWSKIQLNSNRRQPQSKPNLSMPVLVNPNRSKAIPRISETTVPGTLPQINKTKGSFFSSIVDERTQKHKKIDDKAQSKGPNEFPNFSKSTMEKYLNEQKQLHEELMTRNSLNRLKSSVDGGHNFYKLRIRTKLPEDASLLIESIETDRTRTKSFRKKQIKRTSLIESTNDIDESKEGIASNAYALDRAHTYA